MYDLTMDGLLHAGFSKKMATYFSDLLEAEKTCGWWKPQELEWAHSRGFLAESVAAYNLTDDTIKEYLSDYEYYRIWPLNSWERIWINDKLTLKYMLEGTKFSSYMPKYYFYMAGDTLMPLMDCPEEYRDVSIAAFMDLLTEKKDIACKPCNGSLSKGFFQLSYNGGVFYVNGEKCDAAQLSDFIENHPNYIYTEFLYPSEQMKEIFPLIHTVRVLVIKDGKELPQIGGAYMRFGTKDSGYANYMTCTENMKYVYDVNINPESGEYGAGKAVYRNHVEDMPCHPDTGVLVEGKIEAWAEARNMVIALAEYIGLVEYMGFDICFTDQGIKIMEINSHSGIKHLQMRKPLLKEPWSRVYFESKIKKIEMMTEEQIKKRNQMIR